MDQKISKLKDIGGFSLVELLLVVAVVIAIGSISMLIIGTALEARNADVAVRTVSTQMSRARQFSVDARRKTKVTFTAPSTITVEALEGGTWTPVSTVELPGDMELEIDGSISAGPPSVGTLPPFGTSQVADFSGASEIYFMPDGSAVTSAGALTHGVVYVAQPSKVETQRAVTLFGSTGRIKRYKHITGTDWE